MGERRKERLYGLAVLGTGVLGCALLAYLPWSAVKDIRYWLGRPGGVFGIAQDLACVVAGVSAPAFAALLLIGRPKGWDAQASTAGRSACWRPWACSAMRSSRDNPSARSLSR